MTLSAQDSAILGPLFAEPAITALFTDEARIRAMLEVEAALARAEAEARVIPVAAAEAIAGAAAELKVAPAKLGEGVASAAVPIPALVAALRAAAGGEAASYVHWGATSQDILDTALVLRLRDALDHLEEAIAALAAELAEAADRHRHTLMAARTRTQQAAPTTFGLKLAGWLLPLIRHRRRLSELRPRLLTVQLGGAAGTLAALGEAGPAVVRAFANELELAVPPMPWHTQRDGLLELGGWLSLVTGSLGKIGQDFCLLAQSEMAELAEGGEGRGGSSTMPQKANPVGAETLVSLARFNAGQLGTLHQAAVHGQERDGAAWQLEWLTLPPMLAAAGASLAHARELIAGMTVERAGMRAHLDASNGLVMAEAASFALAAHMPRSDAQALVKAAAAEAEQSGRHLADILAQRTQAPVDKAALRDPSTYLGAAERFIDAVLAEAKAP